MPVHKMGEYMKTLMRFVSSALLLATLVHSSFAGVVKVFADVSLSVPFNALAAAFQKVNPDQTVEFNFAASSVLIAQISKGVPADVFASADTENIDKAKSQKLLGKSEVFSLNSVVVVTPSLPTAVKSLDDLAKPGVKIVVASPETPCGRCAAASFSNLDQIFGAGYSAKVAANVVSKEANVKSVLAKVESGEADAGAVFLTDAFSERGKVLPLAIPAKQNESAEYIIAQASSAKNRDGASKFTSFVLSKDGKAILAKFGFKSK